MANTLTANGPRPSPLISARAVISDAPARPLSDARSCSDCGGDGYEVDDLKRCRTCLGHGRMCVDCYGHLEHDADDGDNQCDDCAESDRLDRKACAADDRRACREGV